MVYKSPRQKALEILTAVLDKKKSLKSVLTDSVFSEFNKSDRAFLIELVYGVLRNLYFIDYLLEEFFQKKGGLSSYTVNNLRCALYQLIFMHIPEYAATSEAVNAEKLFNGKPGVVNAILRNFLRKYSNKTFDNLLKSDNFNDKAHYLSVKHSHPQWLVRRWLNRFSPEDVEAFLKANNEKAPFTIAVKPEERQEITDYLNKKGFKTEFTKTVPSGLIVEGQRHEIIKNLKEASFFWIIQDEASQLVCFFVDPAEGLNVLDACSAPGGKTLLIAALMKEGRIVCAEHNQERFKMLTENIERVKKFFPDVKIEPKLADIYSLGVNNLDNTNFDRILLDAPCSSTGVIRRNPDVRYRVSEQEIERLSKNQENLLEKVSSFLAQNGILVYSVCSTEPEEGEIIIDNFLQKHNEFSRIKILRTYPHKDGTDAFFIAKLLKNRVVQTL